MRYRATTALRTHRPLLAILLIFLILATVYNLLLPLYEAPDEYAHFSYANWLARGRGLPNLERDRPRAGHEIMQPPLYYALLAPAISLIEVSDAYNIAPLNTSFTQYDVVHARYHSPAERFPYRGTALAVHLARFLTTLMAMVAIAATYGIARLIIPGHAALAAALIAFNPQFIFMSGAISNDTFVAAMCALTLFMLVWILTSNSVRRWHYILLGALWGLSVLAKVSALGLGLVIGLGLLWQARRQRFWPEIISSGLSVALGLALVAGWWFIRNWLLYGHLLAWPQFLTATRSVLRQEMLSWGELLGYAAILRKTYWAWFAHGYFAPPSFYFLVNAVMLLALIGLVLWLARRRYRNMSRPQVAAIVLLALWSLAAFASLLSWMRQADGTNQGRLFFPAASSLAVLMALGLSNIGRRWPGLISVTALAVWAAALPLLVIRPAFEQPEPLLAGAVIPNPVEVHYDQEIVLLGHEMEDRVVAPGEALDLTLYWQATRPITENYVVQLRAIDSSRRQIAMLETIPYQGRYSTPEWQPGQVFADTYQLPMLQARDSAGIATVLVGLYPVGSRDDRLPVTLAEGSVGDEFAIARFKIASSNEQEFAPEQPADANFEERFRLIGYDLPETIRAGQPFTTTLYWEALAPDGHDYTVFVHLYDPSGQLVAQADSPPQDNRYPTSFWSAGEKVADPHHLDGLTEVSAGDYQLVIGLYDPSSGRRLAAFQEDGRRWPDDSVFLRSLKGAEGK